MKRALHLTLLLLGACDAEQGWTEPFDAEGLGALSSVWGADGEVFVVGGFPEQATVHHFDGTRWSAMEVPEVPLLVWVHGFSADDVWAVGEGGAMVHWDGITWEVIDPGTDDDLWGIFGFSRDALWIVGGDVEEGEPILLSYDGETFDPVVLSEEQNPRGALSLFKVWGIDGQLWAVGQKGLIVTNDGSGWTRQSAGELANDDFVALWGTSRNEVLAVGGRSNARLARFDGTTWTTTAPQATPGLSAVWMASDGTAHVGGLRGWIGTVAPDGTVLQEDPVTTLDLHASWGDGSTVYTVGGRFFTPYEGVALTRPERP